MNKYDINEHNTADLEHYCAENDISVLGKVPFDPNVTKSMVKGIPIVEFAPESPASKAILEAWEKFNELFLV